MKSLRFSLLIAIMFVLPYPGHAQMIKDNTKWTFEAKKISGNDYELIVHAVLEKGWHVYAQKPGGDGSLIAPSFDFARNPKVKLVGGVKEKGKLISKVLIPGDPKVNMYSGTVDYVQKATLSGTKIITGEYTYQICNDNTCLPPTTKTMTFTIK